MSIFCPISTKEIDVALWLSVFSEHGTHRFNLQIISAINWRFNIMSRAILPLSSLLSNSHTIFLHFLHHLILTNCMFSSIAFHIMSNLLFTYLYGSFAESKGSTQILRKTMLCKHMDWRIFTSLLYYCTHFLLH